MLTDAMVERAVRAAQLIPDAALATAADEARRQGQPLADVLLRQERVAERPLYEAVAAAIGLPFVDLEAHPIAAEVLERIPAALATSRRIIAYEANDRAIRVAMEDPDDLEAIELLRRATGLDVIPALATPRAITEAARMYRADVTSGTEVLAVTPAAAADGAPDDRELQQRAGAVSVIRLVDTLLQQALDRQASDIHIEPTERGANVRFRIDGVLQPVTAIPRAAIVGVVARIKVLANLKIDEHRLPQDGRFKITTPAEHIAIRVSIMPIYDGEKIVLRILHEEGKALTLAGLGLRERPLGDRAPLEVVERNARKPHGIIFITGPTGSGKTTTLYALLNLLNTPGVNIATIEDPIEYRISGINQTQVQPRIGLTFASGLRSLLRQDPNVIMVGEIRDAETADVAVNAALTGHLVLATLHTNDAATSLTRLQEMGVPTFLVASTINCIIAQRLVRKLCEPCRKRTAMPADLRSQLEARGAEMGEVLERLDSEARGQKSTRAKEHEGKVALDQLKIWERTACAECTDGYRGRIGIFEVLEVTPAVAERIHARMNRDEIHAQAVADGMATMFVDGMLKAIEGVTTVEEVLRVTRE